MESLTKGILKVLGALTTILTLAGVVYTTVLNPDGNLLLLCAVSVFLLVPAALLSLLWVRLRRKTETSTIEPSRSVTTPFYSERERREGTWVSVAIVVVSLVAGCGLVASNHIRTPVLDLIETDRDDPEILVLHGRRFGDDAKHVLVEIDDRAQAPLSVSDTQIHVAVPQAFEHGNVAVRRGPRTSGSRFFRYLGITYDAAVCKLVFPLRDNPTEPLMDVFRPLPAFPYYSPESDDPWALPPRARRVADEFFNKLEQFFGRPEVKQRIALWRAGTPNNNSGFQAGGPPTPRNRAMMDYSHFRGWFYSVTESSQEALEQALGSQLAVGFLALENDRLDIVESVPTRILVLRVANQQTTDAENFRVEIDVGGTVYDAALNAQGEQLKSLPWSPSHRVLELERLPPGYEAEILVWYSHLPASERVFPGPADVEWEKTEGVRVRNMTISNGYVRRNPRLLADRVLYQRYDVDPIIPRSGR